MATTYANNRRKSVSSITNPTEMVSVAEQGGRMRVMDDTYEAAGDVVRHVVGGDLILVLSENSKSDYRIYYIYNQNNG